MNWMNNIARWRKLPLREKTRRRWESIPERVARSMAFEGEALNLQTLRETHTRHEPPDSLQPRAAS